MQALLFTVPILGTDLRLRARRFSFSFNFFGELGLLKGGRETSYILGLMTGMSEQRFILWESFRNRNCERCFCSLVSGIGQAAVRLCPAGSSAVFGNRFAGQNDGLISWRRAVIVSLHPRRGFNRTTGPFVSVAPSLPAVPTIPAVPASAASTTSPPSAPVSSILMASRVTIRAAFCNFCRRILYGWLRFCGSGRFGRL
jgi:hypothetical protein